VEKQKIMSLLEAARWAPSSSNEQPWRFIVFATSENNKERLEEARSVLSEGNSYAKKAPVLMCAVAKRTYTQSDKDNRHHMHDVGAATAYISSKRTTRALPCTSWEDLTQKRQGSSLKYRRGSSLQR
jgi:nitroreductase